MNVNNIHWQGAAVRTSFKTVHTLLIKNSVRINALDALYKSISHKVKILFKVKTMKFELDYIENLVKLVSANDLTELSLEEEDKAIIIRKEKEIVTTQVLAPQTAQPAVQIAVESGVKTEAKVETPKGLTITSQMVGTFYKGPSPGATPFTEVGKAVSAGQVVCIIEAMKLMNEIESDVSGKIIEVCVQDGEPVEYGQVLMIVEP